MAKGSENVKWQKCENVTLHQNMKMCKTEKGEKVKMMKLKMSLFTLRLKNTIPYRGRGTPHKRQNPKIAQPGGSEITKCRFCPFIWHFGHFWGFLKMSLFSLFHFLFFTFLTFCIFWFYHFLSFFTFSLFPVFWCCWFFVIFYCFLCLWWILIIFCVSFRCLNDDTVFF